MKRTPAKKHKQDGNKDAKSVAGQEGQKTQKCTTSIKDLPAAGTNSTDNANDPQASGTNSTNGTINADTANTNNYDDNDNAKKTGDAPSEVQQTTQLFCHFLIYAYYSTRDIVLVSITHLIYSIMEYLALSPLIISSFMCFHITRNTIPRCQIVAVL